MSAREKLVVTTIKFPPGELAALRAWSARFGRDVSKEVRLACRLLMAGHMLTHLRTEAGSEEARRAGHDPANEVESIEAELHRLTVEAYTPPTEVPSAAMALR